MNFWQRLIEVVGGTADTADDTTTKPMGRVVSDGSRCVQCGICGYNCPVGIPVRDYARQGLPVDDSACITCGQCIAVCPRGTLRWETDQHALVETRFITLIEPAAESESET
jgi:ferredoxin